jgi:hypothetical protein
MPANRTFPRHGKDDAVDPARTWRNRLFNHLVGGKAALLGHSGRPRKPQSTVQGFSDNWLLEWTVQAELMVPTHLGNGVARRMLEQSGEDLPRLVCAAKKSRLAAR